MTAICMQLPWPMKTACKALSWGGTLCPSHGYYTCNA